VALELRSAEAQHRPVHLVPPALAVALIITVKLVKWAKRWGSLAVASWHALFDGILQTNRAIFPVPRREPLLEYYGRLGFGTRPGPCGSVGGRPRPYTRAEGGAGAPPSAVRRSRLVGR
jgi:hypothetical protein